MENCKNVNAGLPKDLVTRENFDEKRGLAAHQDYLNLRVQSGKKTEGDCSGCAKVDCLMNVTKQKILEALGVGDFDAIKQFECDSFEQDKTIPQDLRYSE